MCPHSATVAATALAFSPQEVESETDEAIALMDARSELEQPARTERPVSRLIEFPGVTRRPVPQWRKELGERVREVQERRARESAAEAEATDATAPPEDLPVHHHHNLNCYHKLERHQ